MKWKPKYKKWDNIKIGDTRNTTKFLLFPLSINGEWRWLEKATYKQECVEEMNYASMDYGYHKEWRNKEYFN